MPIQDQSLLEAALLGLEAQKERIDAQIQQVRTLLGKRGPGRPPKNAIAEVAQPAATAPASTKRAATKKRGRRKMSAEGRARIAEAQRRRWAALKG